jgi:hypothetical protein
VDDTDPEPVPENCTDTVEENRAVAELYRLTVTEHVEDAPAQAPVQPSKTAPGEGVAVRSTMVPFEYFSMQSLPQLTPVPVMVPRPWACTVRKA